MDVFFLFAGFNLLFSIYMAVGIPCKPTRSFIRRGEEERMKDTKADVDSNRFRGVDQYHLDVLSRPYRRWGVLRIVKYRMASPGHRRRITIQACKSRRKSSRVLRWSLQKTLPDVGLN